MSALPEPAAQPVDVIPLSAHIGAEIRGIDRLDLDFDRQPCRPTLAGDVPVEAAAAVALP